MKPGLPRFFGRRDELEALAEHASRCGAGNGSTVFIIGERGVGKTRLLEAFQALESVRGFSILRGSATKDAPRPFEAFSSALPELRRFHEEAESSSFSRVFVMDRRGGVTARASADGQSDTDALAAAVAAVQQFVRDSFEPSSGVMGLGRLECGGATVLIEQGREAFIAGVFHGAQHGDMARALRDALGRAEAASAGGADASGAIAPLLSQRFRVRRDLEGVKLSNERIKIADAVFRMLSERASERPVALVLDDVQWMDESSRFVLEYLARNVRAKRVMVLCTARSGENEAVEAKMAAMEAEGISRTVRLSGLGGDDFAGMLSDMGAALPPAFRTRIHDACRGNPLFAIEVVRRLAEEGSLSRTGDGGALPVPGSLEEVVQSRVGRLEPAALTLCECASCIGTRFETGAVSGQEFLPEPDAAFSQAGARGIVAKGEPDSEFLHAIYPELIYKEIGPRWKTAYHRALGAYFEKAHGKDDDAVIYELAKHFLRCSDDDKASQYCMRAGEKAEKVFAMSDAIEYYRAAAAAFERLGGDEATRHASEACERLGDAFTLVGRMKEAEEALRKALAATPSGETAARLHRKLSIAIMKRGDFEGALGEVEAGTALVDGSCLERQRLLIQRGNIRMLSGRIDQAIEDASSALRALGDAAGAETELGNCHNILGTCMWYKGENGQAIEHHAKALGYRKAAGNGRRIALSQNNIGLVYHKSGDLAKALEFYEASLREWERTGDRDGMTAAYGNIGIVRWNRGDMAGALDLFRKAASISEAIGDKPGMATAYGNIGMTIGDMGDTEGSLEYGDRCRALSEASGVRMMAGMALVNNAKTLMFVGEHSKALGLLEEAAAIFTEAGSADLLATARIVIADALVESGDLEGARKALEGASDQGENPDVELVKGKLSTASGDFGAAAKSYSLAKSLYEAQGNLRSLPEASYGMGELKAKAGDTAGAAEEFSEARRLFDGMGMRGWSERCARRLAELGR